MTTHTESAPALRTHLTEIESALTEFDKISAGLADLQRRYANVIFPVATPCGMKDACAARAEIRAPRYAAAKIAESAKKPLNDLKRNIQTRADYIIDAILKIEEPIHQQIAAEEARKAAEKVAREAAERARVERIQTAIAAIRTRSTNAMLLTAEALAAELAAMEAAPPGDGFEEFAPEAGRVMAESLQAMRVALVAKQEAEETARREAAARAERDRLQAIEAERLRAEREELERLRAEQARQADAARQALARERAEQDRIAAEARAAEEARLQAERDEIARQRAEIERQRAEQDRIAAEARAAEAAQAAVQVAPPPPAPASPGPDDLIGPAELKRIFAPLPLTAAVLEHFGIHPANQEGPPQYAAADVPKLCAGLIQHLEHIASTTRGA